MKNKRMNDNKLNIKGLKSANNVTEKSLNELSKIVDENYKVINKKHRILIKVISVIVFSVLSLLPVVVYAYKQPVSVTIHSSVSETETYMYKVDRGAKIEDIPIVEIEGYNFVGFYKDEEYQNIYKANEEFTRKSLIYASYKIKEYAVNICVDENNYSVQADSIVTHGGDLSFTITPKKENKLSWLSVLVNGEEVLLKNGTCVINNITSDSNVEIVANKVPIKINCGSTTLNSNFLLDSNLGDVIKNIKSLGYKTNGVVYTDDQYENKVDLSGVASGELNLYAKEATLDKLKFNWSETTAGWKVKAIDRTIKDEVVIPQYYTDGEMDAEVTKLDEKAFYGASNLTSITLPNSIYKIEEHSFAYTSIEKIELPQKLEKVKDGLFECSRIKEVVIPENVYRIGDGVFYACGNLVKITIPNSVEYMGSNVFDGCSNLQEVTIPNSVTTFGEAVFYNCRCLNKISLPSEITHIGNNMFYNCKSLTSVTIPSKVESLGSGVFTNCSSISEIQVEKGNTSFSSSGNCLIEKATKTLLFGVSNTIIPTDNSVEIIGESAFNGCENLTEIIIPEGVKIISSSAFKFCKKLTTITLPNSVEIIGASAFANCQNLVTVIMGNNVKSIGNDAFYWCFKLQSINLSNQIENIGRNAFNNCMVLKELIIPEKVTEIGEYAFSGCDKLKSSIEFENLVGWQKNAGSNMFPQWMLVDDGNMTEEQLNLELTRLITSGYQIKII